MVPHLAINTYMKSVLYKESSVTTLEPVEWIHKFNQSGLLNLFRVPHYHRSNINLIIIKQLMCLVHDECLRVSAPIPITDMLIHWIMLLPHLGLNLAKQFGKKTSEHDLVEKMKDKFKLVKKPCGYSITSITYPVVKVAMQILSGKVMRKCRMDEVPTPVVSLATQCVEGMQFNWVCYLCSEFLENCREA